MLKQTKSFNRIMIRLARADCSTDERSTQLQRSRRKDLNYIFLKYTRPFQFIRIETGGTCYSAYSIEIYHN